MTAVASVETGMAPFEQGGGLSVTGNVVAFTQDESTQAALNNLSHTGVAPQMSVVPGGLSTAVATGAPDCAVLLVDISDSPDPAADIQHLTERGAAHIIATGPVNDVSLYRALTEAGARDYLVSPIVEDELARALVARPHNLPAEVPELTSTATAIIGTRRCRGDDGRGQHGLAAGARIRPTHRLAGSRPAVRDLRTGAGPAAWPRSSGGPGGAGSDRLDVHLQRDGERKREPPRAGRRRTAGRLAVRRARRHRTALRGHSARFQSSCDRSAAIAGHLSKAAAGAYGECSFGQRSVALGDAGCGAVEESRSHGVAEYRG